MTAPIRSAGLVLRPATPADAERVADLVDAAFRPYVERLGTIPGPMTYDYDQVIREQQVTVAEVEGRIEGVIVLAITEEGFLVDTVAVHPSRHGMGIGRALLELAEAEARRAGFASIYLYTHERMIENIGLYARIGYVEYERRSLGDFSLVFMRKVPP